MTFSFSGPSLASLGPSMLGAIFVGEVYSAVAGTNRQPIKILMVKEIADWAFYEVASAFSQNIPQNKAKIYAVTNLTVNIATLIVLRRLQLIGNMGTVIFSSFMAIEMICKQVDFPKYRADP